jgi:acetolactate synthase-1/2/3 large subunit
MLDLSHPDLDFVALAQGLGVAATRAASAEEFDAQFTEAMAGRGPRLIEAMVVQQMP